MVPSHGFKRDTWLIFLLLILYPGEHSTGARETRSRKSHGSRHPNWTGSTFDTDSSDGRILAQRSPSGAMKTRLFTLPCVLALFSGSLGAQSIGLPDSSSVAQAGSPTSERKPGTAHPLQAILQSAGGAGLSLPLIQLTQEPESPPGWGNRILTALGGALIGMGVGYFASQVALSDWSEGSGKHKIRRPLWAGVGGGLGFALGFSFPLSGGGGPPGVGGVGGVGNDRSFITADQIREISATDALEAVQALRPEWLIQRGQEDFYDPEGDNIRVYLDEIDIGGIEALAGLTSLTIASIRFIDAAHATARWGAGHTQGVIQVIQLGRRSP
jgi:hypothetical protein